MRYASMRCMDISNGKGLGVSLFVQGCPIHCEGCFNKEAWDFDGGKEWTIETENKFLELANKPYINRISILGGEPLADENCEAVYNLTLHLKSTVPEKKIWLYTGFIIDDFLFCDKDVTEIMQNTKLFYKLFYKTASIYNCDVVVDGPYIHSLRDPSLKWRGSSNQRVIDIDKTISNGKVTLFCD